MTIEKRLELALFVLGEIAKGFDPEDEEPQYLSEYLGNESDAFEYGIRYGEYFLQKRAFNALKELVTK